MGKDLYHGAKLSSQNTQTLANNFKGAAEKYKEKNTVVSETVWPSLSDLSMLVVKCTQAPCVRWAEDPPL